MNSMFYDCLHIIKEHLLPMMVKILSRTSMLLQWPSQLSLCIVLKVDFRLPHEFQSGHRSQNSSPGTSSPLG